MKTVIVRYYDYGNPRNIIAFSSTKMLLKFYQQRHPRAKRLRIKEFPSFIQVLNHNTPLDWSTPVTIRRLIINEQTN